MTTVDNIHDLEKLKRICLDCDRCGLAATRRNVVFGRGSSKAKVFLLGEAPGANEDRCGQPFVGLAGGVLDRFLAEAGLDYDQIYVTGSVKCRPPHNRNPRRLETAACRVYLDKQLSLISPRVVVCLGLIAVHNLLDPGARLSDVRGKWFQSSRFWILPTYHPAAILRHAANPALFLDDLIMVKELASQYPSPG